MPKARYPLDVFGYSEDGIYCYSKGHHDFEAFKLATQAWYGEDMSNWNPPRHEWWRAVPSGCYNVLHEAKPFSRGAFPVTVMDLD